ncbi:hypothetical protein TNCV_4170101 [Trichonephila clavipes]|nr:hypothetical protein TNCV_4170101 [Trichonephila clavipes]
MQECQSFLQFFFSFYVPVGRATAFDGEIAAIRTALSQLQCNSVKCTRAVILSDSRASLLAVASDNNPITQDDLFNRVSHKSWWNAILNLRNVPRRRAVTELHLATGHDCLRNHLYKIRAVPSSICILCSSGEVMDSVHLVHCPALHKTFLNEHYWETRDILD